MAVYIDEEDERSEALEREIVYAFYTLLLEDEYQMSHERAQELYNRICAIVMLIPTKIKKI